jgi:mono/diheme cytochrome c family protein
LKTFLVFALSAVALLLGVGGFGVVLLKAQEAPKDATNVWTAPGRAARKQNPTPSDGKSIVRGKELFTVGCFPCHGPLGSGDGPAAASLERKPGNLSDPKMWQQSDGAIFWKISEGNAPMPSFQETFSEKQRWDIVNYVRTLAPKETNNKHTAQSGDHP